MNRIICVPGANLDLPAELALEALDAVDPAIVIAQFETPQSVSAAAFAAARARGVTTVLNPAPAADPDAALLAVTDWLVPNEHEFVLLGGDPLTGDEAAEDAAIRRLAEHLGVGLVVTLGERGAAVLGRGEDVARVRAPRVRAVDTTGAGDAFVGAFAVGLASGWTSTDAARLGCAFAADSVTRPGTQASFATPDEARAILHTVAS
jgi:ribokinase